jgi:diguanylate cyclase (GGDEF)-like protein
MQSRRTGNQLALLFIDLVGFKEINERYGHVQGDIILRKIGEVFEKLIRGNDLAGRIGGDEFLVLLGDLNSADNACVVASKLIEQISRIRLTNISEEISTNIGMLVFVADESSTIESILSSADNMLQQARKAGPGQYRLLDMTVATHMAMQK